ncbi:MAG: sigma-70 family RNA polymerase sigma factor [Burkholderiaceae bacterium]
MLEPAIISPPLAAVQCRALAGLARAAAGVRVFRPGQPHPRPADWRKPAFAGAPDMAQWAGANARRDHGPRPSTPLPAPPAGDAPVARQRPAAMTPQPPPRDAPRLAAAAGEALFDDPDTLHPDHAVADEPDEPDAGAAPWPAAAAVSLDDAGLAALIDRIGHHDDKALAALYDATAPRVFGLVGCMLNDTGLAEEVVEDTYWQVWRQAERYDPGRGRPVTWLLAMARSRAIDAMRRRERRALAPLGDDEQADLADETTPSPPDLLAATNGQHLLHRALETLEPQPRQLVALAFFRGLTHEEIADCTQLPLGTVKSQIRRALLALRHWLEEAGCPGLPL